MDWPATEVTEEGVEEWGSKKIEGVWRREGRSQDMFEAPDGSAPGRQPPQADVEFLPHRFQGIRDRRRRIPQVSVIPANTRPAPTKTDSPIKAGWTSHAR